MILVTYASRSGSTAGIAEAIGRTLTQMGLTADVRPMQDVHDITPYSAVIAGSAIRQEKWLPEAMEFTRRYQAELTKKPFAAFLVCLALAMQGERSKQTAHAWLQPVRELVNPVSEGFFAGTLHINKIPDPLPRMAFRVVTTLRIFKEGDYRDWEAIQQWTESLPAKLIS